MQRPGSCRDVKRKAAVYALSKFKETVLQLSDFLDEKDELGKNNISRFYEEQQPAAVCCLPFHVKAKQETFGPWLDREEHLLIGFNFQC